MKRNLYEWMILCKQVRLCFTVHTTFPLTCLSMRNICIYKQKGLNHKGLLHGNNWFKYRI